MPFTDLREFVAHLHKHGRLHRVTVPVSRDLEITEITDRVSKRSGGANVALLFEHVERFDMPVLVNAFGSEDRMTPPSGGAPGRSRRPRAKLLDLKMPGNLADRFEKRVL